MNMPSEPTDPALFDKMPGELDYVSTKLIPLPRNHASLGKRMGKIATYTWLSLRRMVRKLEHIAVTRRGRMS